MEVGSLPTPLLRVSFQFREVQAPGVQVHPSYRTSLKLCTHLTLLETFLHLEVSTVWFWENLRSSLVITFGMRLYV